MSRTEVQRTWLELGVVRGLCIHLSENTKMNANCEGTFFLNAQYHIFTDLIYELNCLSTFCS